MNLRYLAICNASLLLAGCATDPSVTAVRSNVVTSYWFRDVDPASTRTWRLLVMIAVQPEGDAIIGILSNGVANVCTL